MEMERRTTLEVYMGPYRYVSETYEWFPIVDAEAHQGEGNSTAMEEMEILEACRRWPDHEVEVLYHSFRLRFPRRARALLLDMMAVATRHDRVDVMQYCLEFGPLVTEAVYDAAIEHRSWRVYLYLLVQSGVGARLCLNSGKALCYAAEDNKLRLTRYLLSQGADPNSYGLMDAFPPITVAAGCASVGLMRLLLHCGARLAGSGAIILAAQCRRRANVEFLLEQGADVNEMSLLHHPNAALAVHRSTALHEAVKNGDVWIAEALILAFAHLHIRDGMGRTPIGLAKLEGKTVMVDLLISHGAPE